MMATCQNQPDAGGLNVTLEVRYKKFRPLQHDHAIEAVHRSLIRAIQSGLVEHRGPIGSEISAKIFCGRHADKVNSVACAILMTFDGASSGDYEQYQKDLKDNFETYLAEGILDFSVSGHDVDHIEATVYQGVVLSLPARS